MQSATVAFHFILHIQVCLYVHNAIDISACHDRTYGKIRPPAPPAVSSVIVRSYINCISIVNTAAARGYINCILLYNKGANLPKSLHSKDLYQLHFNASTYVNPFIY